MRDLWLLASRWRKKHLEYFAQVEFEGERRKGRERERGSSFFTRQDRSFGAIENSDVIYQLV